MSTDRRRLVDPCGSPWSTGEGFLVRAGRRRSAAFAAALGVTVLMLSAAPALALPGIESPDIVAAPGITACAFAEDVVNATGAKKSFTAVKFSTDEYYDAQGTGIFGGGDAVCVRAKHSASLRALPSPPPSPFTVTATLDIALNRDDWKGPVESTDTLNFVTRYITDASSDPTPASGFTVNSPPGTLLSIKLEAVFDNRGTNPRFIDAVFSNPEYLDSDYPRVTSERVFWMVKDNDELNSLLSPPSSTFTHWAMLVMTNDEGAIAENEITIETTYAKETTTPTPPRVKPTPKADVTLYAPPDVLVSTKVGYVFDNPGTNAKLTDASFSTLDYYDSTTISGIFVYVKAKSSEDLNALPSPPPNPFTVTATVTMTNDEGDTVENTVTFTTRYDRAAE